MRKPKYDPKFLKHWRGADMPDAPNTEPMKRVLYGYWCAGYRDGVNDMKALNMALHEDPLHPPPSLLCKLGSVAVHVEEMLSPEGHHFDRIALTNLLHDPELRQWIEAMDRLAMIPKKR